MSGSGKRAVPPESCMTCDSMQQQRSSPEEGSSKEQSSSVQELDGSEVVDGPEALLKEEASLRVAREKKTEVERRGVAPKKASSLDKKRFGSLDELLGKAGMYVKFLAEHINKQEAENVRLESSSTSTQTQVGGKRKGRSAAGPSKKQKAAEGEEQETPEQVTARELAATKELTPLINGAMRDYQLKGVRWLISLYQNGINGILADQMGLGKTVQTIGFLAHLRHKGVGGPFLVVGPLSTLPNWVAEFKRWAPSMNVLLYHGSKKEREVLRAKQMPTGARSAAPTFPVVCTSFEIVMADVNFLRKYGWKYVVVDEGHRLKNSNCRLLRELRQIPTDNKLLLTGTPLQNNLSELWSLLNFLLPDIFADLGNFQDWFDAHLSTDTLEAQEEDKESFLQQRDMVAGKLHGLLRPFLLRRIKSDVETSIPGKAEILLYAAETALQARLNKQLRDRTLNELVGKDASGLKVSRLNNVLMQMRKNCNHPDLIEGPMDGSTMYPSAKELVEQSGKLALLERLLDRLHAHGHKVLIFSQMTKMLDILDTFLEQTGRSAVRLDGGVKWEDRQAAIAHFGSEADVKTFLLSTRAGGLGINLTHADTCIIFDSDWNPHQDLQAMDRCHRIGQTKPVLVFRLATAHSVEGKLLARAHSKLALERLVIKKGAFLPDLEAGEGGKVPTLKGEELLDILKEGGTDDVAQSGVVSDKVLDQLLDRSHLEKGVPAPYPSIGVGYSVTQQQSGSGLLSGVE